MRLAAPSGLRDTLAHPVASRRLGGAGVAIDLNPDHSCNWRCVYCDVDGLVDAKAGKVDLDVLGGEVRELLGSLRGSDWLEQNAPAGLRELRGLLVCGNGEPTLSFQLQGCIELVGSILSEGENGSLRPVLVTNGSNVNNRKVREGLEQLTALDGEIWFKLDSATREGQRDLNRVDSTLRQARENMRVAAGLCPTVVQTCVLAINGEPVHDEREQKEYLSFLTMQLRAGVTLRGVHLYVPDRPSAQADGATVSAPPTEWIEAFADRIRELDLEVTVFA